MKNKKDKSCRHPTCKDGVCRRVKKKEKLVSLPKLTAKAQKVFNAWIRSRDEGKPCISCGSLKADQAGHYFPVKQFGALRFEEMNAHLQDAYCNCYCHGNQAMYRIGLVKRYGELYVEELERMAIENSGPKKWSRSELEGIIFKYGFFDRAKRA